MMKNFKIADITYHRNGVGGQSFNSVRFSFSNDSKFYPNMLAIVPATEKPKCSECYVVNIDSPTENWRGENFFPEINASLKK